MSDTTLIALLASGAALALGCLIAWLVVRGRRRPNDIGELPTFLYLAGQTTTSPDAVSRSAGTQSGRAPAVPYGRAAAQAGSGVAAWSPRPEHEAKSTTLGWAPAADETVQLLPGRLEPVPEGSGQEIRFVRQPGVTRFTFGRARGPGREHVQLRVASVSRMHAYMEFDGGRWRIGSLSQTNSVLVNGACVGSEETCVLEDGDRIEMGEAVFSFRHPALRVEPPVLSRVQRAAAPDAEAAG
jgi:hypothetical protein